VHLLQLLSFLVDLLLLLFDPLLFLVVLKLLDIGFQLVGVLILSLDCQSIDSSS